MKQDDNTGRLFTGFPPVTTEAWEEAILRDLKGADYAKKLIWTSPEGINIRPYYRAEDLEKLKDAEFNPLDFNFVRSSGTHANSWLIRQDIEVTDFTEARDKAVQLLGLGVQSVGFRITEPHTVEEARAFLEGLPLEEAEFSYEGFEPGLLLEALGGMADDGLIDPQKINGCCEYDILGDFSLYGSFEFDVNEEFANLAEWMEEAERFPGLLIAGVHGRHFHDSGATIAQELGYSLAMAAEYLHGLTEFLVPADLAAAKISFHLSAGSEYFLEIAKFRAARILWRRLMEAYEIDPDDMPPMYLHAETSKWNQTVYDPHVNLLRSTTEAMSAALGGVDSLTVTPFDHPYEEPTAFAERIARNQQILLQEEAFLDRVADPAAGSYFLETLTASVAAAAWQVFESVEEAGGYIEAFYAGLVQDAIVSSAMERDRNLSQRREVLVGTNHYPNPAEEMLLKVDSARVRSTFMDSSLAEAQPLNRYRVAEEFEAVRFETERSGRRPLAFMLTIGHPAMRKARAGFASNFFGCAGYTVMDNPGFDTLEEGVEAALNAGADLIVLCSSDEEYATLGEPFAALVGTKAIPVLAGYPKDILDRLKGAGIHHFVHVRSHVLETLRTFNSIILKK